jgi:hypothetical protein
MTRTHLVTVVGVILIALIFAYSQSPQRTSKPAQTATQAEPSKPVKARKVLVKELPKGLEGIELKNGEFKLKPGYKFVPDSNSSGTVALQTGGLSDVDGKFKCSCSVDGSCTFVSHQGTLFCVKKPTDTCTEGVCDFTVTIGGLKTKLAIF